MARPTVSSDALVSSIQSEIQRVQDDLLGVEENLKRLTGRDFNEPRGERRIRQISTGERVDEPPPKRRPPGGVFARLGDLVTDAPSRGRRVHEVLEDGEIPRQKPSVASSVARPINDGKSRTEAAAELTKDRASRDRNRRMFGALLGTLQRFRTEEAKSKGKDEQRAKIEKKLEEKGRAEKEELRKERIELINQRKERQLRIERLNFKIERVKEHEAWEAGQRRLGRFVRTQSKPRIFWLPKVNNSRTSSLISQTKHSIERELEEARVRLKDELDEALGGRGNYSFKSDVQERESEIDNDDFNNGSDLLDYDAEEGELVYDDLLLSGKQKEKGMGSERRVVVQVDSDISRAPQRRVELVTVVAERGRRVKDVEENESEKENVIKSKVNVEHKKVNENVGDKGRGKEKEKKKEREKDKSRGKEKRIDKKVSPEKQQKSHFSSRDPLRKESKSSRKEKNKEEEIAKVREAENEKLTENETKVYGETDKSDNDDDKVTSDANITNEEENSTHGTEDLSQISLPLDPEPESTQKITEVVVQHVPLNCNGDSQNADEEEMQVETVLLDTSQIKQDKTEWDNNFPPLPIVIKKEKDATPERATEEKRVVSIKTRDEKAERKKDDSSSDSSDSDSDSSAESEDDDDDDDSSSEDSSSESSSSSDEEDKKKKRKDKKESSSDEDRKKKKTDKEKESSSDDQDRKKKRIDKEKESSSDEEERKKRNGKGKESSSEDEDRKKKRNDQEKESSSDEEDRKKKKKEKEKSRSRRKEQSSSSESSESDDSESDSDSSSEDEKKKRKKIVEKRKPSPKYSRRGERERESERKKGERKKDIRKSSRSRSRSRDRRSRSRDRRRVRSRSRDRRRDRR